MMVCVHISIYINGHTYFSLSLSLYVWVCVCVCLYLQVLALREMANPFVNCGYKMLSGVGVAR